MKIIFDILVQNLSSELDKKIILCRILNILCFPYLRINVHSNSLPSWPRWEIGVILCISQTILWDHCKIVHTQSWIRAKIQLVVLHPTSFSREMVRVYFVMKVIVFGMMRMIHFPKPAVVQFQFCQIESELFQLKHGQCQSRLSGKWDFLENTVSHLQPSLAGWGASFGFYIFGEGTLFPRLSISVASKWS